MALDLGQRFVSVQYLGNKWTEFHQILYMHSYCQHIRWDCYTSFLHICTRVMALDLLQNFVPLNIVRTKGEVLTKLYIAIYTDKIYVRIVNCHFSHICTSVLDLRQNFDILRTNGQNFTKFYICIYIDKIYVWIVSHHFSHICTRVMKL